MIDRIQKAHVDYFGQKSELTVVSPARINLIGEHTDYNDGFVMPGAIDYHITFSFSKSKDKTARVIGLDVNDEIRFPIKDIDKVTSFWGSYIKGTVAQFVNAKVRLGGFNCVFSGNIPIGAGLSSSAALTCGLAYGLNEIFNLSLTKWDIAKMAQKAEHQYARVFCGIMDQFANLFSKKNEVSILDCRSLDFEQQQLDMANHDILLIDTGVKHKLASTEYNIRKQQCELATSILQNNYEDVMSLRDANPEMIESCKTELGETLYAKAAYVVEENGRVQQGFQDLQSGNMEEFGKKMVGSHEGLRDKYNVSCEELDFLVDHALQNSNVYGARMMGGGFGGCTINIMKQGAGDQLKAEITARFDEKFSVIPKFYSIKLLGGTHAI